MFPKCAGDAIPPASGPSEDHARALSMNMIYMSGGIHGVDREGRFWERFGHDASFPRIDLVARCVRVSGRVTARCVQSIRSKYHMSRSNGTYRSGRSGEGFSQRLLACLLTFPFVSSAGRSVWRRESNVRAL